MTVYRGSLTKYLMPNYLCPNYVRYLKRGIPFYGIAFYVIALIYNTIIVYLINYHIALIKYGIQDTVFHSTVFSTRYPVLQFSGGIPF